MFWFRVLPPNRSDLNPFDNCVLSAFERVTNKKTQHSVVSLRGGIEVAFAEINRPGLRMKAVIKVTVLEAACSRRASYLNSIPLTQLKHICSTYKHT